MSATSDPYTPETTLVDTRRVWCDGAGETIYVARPTDPRMLRRTDALVMERFSPSRLCVDEPIRTVDRHGGYFTGVVFLQDFVPYTREG